MSREKRVRKARMAARRERARFRKELTREIGVASKLLLEKSPEEQFADRLYESGRKRAEQA